MRKIRVRFSARERTDMYALWRYIGYVIGAPQDLIPDNETYGRQLNDLFQLLDPGPDNGARSLVHSAIRTATPQEGAEALDVFPKIVTTLMPPARLRKLMYGLMRYWSGQKIADDLHVPDTAWKYAGPVIRPLVTAKELTRAFLPHNDEAACAATVRMLSGPLRGMGDAPPVALPKTSPPRSSATTTHPPSQAECPDKEPSRTPHHFRLGLAPRAPTHPP